MPRRRKISYEMRRSQNKLRRRKIKEEQLRKLQELQLINGNGESSEPVQREVSPPRISHAEYVRNYRKNMSEERKQAARALAAWRMAERRKCLPEEKKAEIREADRLRIALKRKNMSEEERSAEREYHRQRMAEKRKNMTEEEKHAAREADRLRMAMKRQKWKEQSDHFHSAMLQLGLQTENVLLPPVELNYSTPDNEAPEDIQRFLAITLITGHSVTFN